MQKKINDTWISFFYNHKNQLEYIARQILCDKTIPLTIDDFLVEAMDEIKKLLESSQQINTTYILKACEYRFRNLVKKYTTKKHNVLNNAYLYQENEIFDIPSIEHTEYSHLITEIKNALNLTNDEKLVLDNYIIGDLKQKEITQNFNISKYKLKLITNQLKSKIINII